MNREIKFRGKIQGTNDFVYGYYIRQYGCRNGIKFFTDFIYSEDYIDSNDELYYPIDINTLGQYTGLKDKNGVEIYEGDIVRDDINRVFIIEWKFGGFNLSPLKWLGDEFSYNPMGDIQCAGFINENCETIDNIYENPELLEV